MLALALLVTALAAGPASPAPETAPDALSTPSSADAYDAQRARRDVDLVLTDDGKDYLRARARLQRAPAVAASELIARLEATPPLGPGERKRLLDVLAALGRPEDAARLGQAFVRALRNTKGERAQAQVLSLWRPLILERGEAAAPTLRTLVGEQTLPLGIRRQLLADWIAIAPSAELPKFLALVGRGHRELQQQLHASLEDRAHDSNVNAALQRALDEALAQDPDVTRRPALLSLRVALSTGPDEALARQLSELALAESAAFPVRVVAVRGLGQLEEHAALADVARAMLRERHSQAGELLSTIAIEHLPKAQAARVVADVHLTREPAPRLAVLGYRHGELSAQQAWLEAALAHPWPQVRQAALERIEAPCATATVQRLGKTAGPLARGGEADRATARAAVVALGRCGSIEELGRLLEDDTAAVDQRAEAARQLVRRAGPAGVDRVARLLERDVDRILAQRLVRALGYATSPTSRALAALCERVDEGNEVGRAAVQSLREVAPPDHVCERSS